jgi:predicted hydrocarbon binding protein
MAKNKAQLLLFGDSFNILKENADDVKSTIDNLFNSFDSLTKDQIQELENLIKKWEELTGKIYENKKAHKENAKVMELNNVAMQGAQNMLGQFAVALGKDMAGVGGFWDSIKIEKNYFLL